MKLGLCVGQFTVTSRNRCVVKMTSQRLAVITVISTISTFSNYKLHFVLLLADDRYDCQSL